MPPQTQQSNLFAKYKNRMDAALQKAVETPIDLGRGPSITPGINNGIGKITHCGFQPIAAGKTNAGEPLFRIAGVCVEGRALVGQMMVDCTGQQTSQIVSCCDTGTPGDASYKSFDQNLKKVVDIMRAVCGDEFVAGCSGADLEGLAAAIEEAAPYFRFSTSVREAREYMDPKTKKMVKGEAGVWENWHDSRGSLVGYVPPDATVSGVKDKSPATAPVTTQAPTAKPTPAAPKSQPASAKTPPPTAPPTEVATAEEPEFDLSALVAQAVAEQGDQVPGTAAQEQLLELARQHGVYDEVFALDQWADAEPILAAAMGAVGSAEAAAAELAWVPEVGQVYGFRYPVIDPVTKKLGKAKVKSQVEIASVNNGDTKTVTLKDAATKRLHSDGATKRPIQVAWEELESAD